MIGRQPCCATIAIHLTLRLLPVLMGVRVPARGGTGPTVSTRSCPVPRAITYYHAAPLLINSPRSYPLRMLNQRPSQMTSSVTRSLSVCQQMIHTGKTSLYVQVGLSMTASSRGRLSSWDWNFLKMFGMIGTRDSSAFFLEKYPCYALPAHTQLILRPRLQQFCGARMAEVV